MTDETIVAVYDTAVHAEAAIASLKAAGVPASSISMHANSTGMSTNTTTASPVREEGFWASLFGGSPDHDTTVYEQSVASGSTVVSVSTPEQHVDRVLEILENHHPIDIDDRAASYGLTKTTTDTAPLPVGLAKSNVAPSATMAPGRTDDTGMLQLSEETLAVGKRVINRGGTRIRRFVVEKPVEESVSLHSEKVVLERHPVTDGRAPVDSFTDKTIEMTESAEEAIVSKTAHVYEEVGLRKEVSDRVETVRDKVRREEVKIEQVPGAQTANTVEPASTRTANTTDKVFPKV